MQKLKVRIFKCRFICFVHCRVEQRTEIFAALKQKPTLRASPSHDAFDVKFHGTVSHVRADLHLFLFPLSSENVQVNNAELCETTGFSTCRNSDTALKNEAKLSLSCVMNQHGDNFIPAGARQKENGITHNIK